MTISTEQLIKDAYSIYDGLLDIELTGYEYPLMSECGASSLYCVFGPERPNFSNLVDLSPDPASVMSLLEQTFKESNLNLRLPTSSSDFEHEMTNPQTQGAFIICPEFQSVGHVIGIRKLHPESQSFLVANTESDRLMQVIGPEDLVDQYLNADYCSIPPFAGRKILIFTNDNSEFPDLY